MRRECLWDLTVTVDEKRMFMRAHHNSRWAEKMSRKCLWDLTVTVDEKKMLMRSHHNSRWEENVYEISPS